MLPGSAFRDTNGDRSLTATVADRSVAKRTKVEKPRLDALTSLRFFAATSIVLMHFRSSILPESAPFLQNFAFFQGVSFFYVLSGFILAYVYPKLDGLKQILNFLRARFARVYPTHLLTLIISASMLRTSMSTIDFCQLLGCNLLLVQDWIPVTAFYWSFNSPAWSISCEFFFYLCFPFLIFRFAHSWWAKVLVCGVVTATMISLATALRLPTCPPDLYVMTSDWFTTLSPLTRIFEFSLGMSMAMFYLKRHELPKLPSATATRLEILMLSAAILYSMVGVPIGWIAPHVHLPTRFWDWMLAGGGAPIYALTIYVFARRAGAVSNFLSKPFFVLLGEISYALYLIHMPVVQFISLNQSHLHTVPSWLMAVAFWVVVLAGSYLSFELVEAPLRGFMMGRGLRSPQFLKTAVLANVSALLVVGASVVFAFNQSANEKRTADAQQAKLVVASTPARLRGTKFGDLFALDGCTITQGADGNGEITLSWRALKNVHLKRLVAVHLINKPDDIVRKDYGQDKDKRRVEAGEVWIDKVPVCRSELLNAKRLGICLYEDIPNRLVALPIDRGLTDWGNQLLLIDLKDGHIRN